MAFNANIENFQRFSVHQLADPREANASHRNRFAEARAYAKYERRLNRDGDMFARSDDDRAFNLVARAAELIDYRLPFAVDKEAKALIEESKQLLNEACSLDPYCFDAQRMLAASNCPSYGDYHSFLIDHAPEVKHVCEQNAQADARPENSWSKLARNLAMRPYLRWLASEASQALICGRYRCCVESSARLIEADHEHISDAYRTLAFALVKLEDEQALNDLIEASDKSIESDPWLALASIAMAYKAHRLTQASEIIEVVLNTWPRAGRALSVQQELPEGVFARPGLVPLSEDELIMAVAEASVFLQEGRDSYGRGALGSWLAHEPQVVEAYTKERENPFFSPRDVPDNPGDPSEADDPGDPQAFPRDQFTPDPPDLFPPKYFPPYRDEDEN